MFIILNPEIFIYHQFILDLCAVGTYIKISKKVYICFYNGDYFPADFSIELLWFGVKESY